MLSPPGPPARPGGRGFWGTHFGLRVFLVFVFLGIVVCGFQASEGSSFFLLVKLNIECRQNHVWGPPGARVMSIFVKTYIFGKDALDETHG